MKDNPTPTLPLAGEGVEAKEKISLLVNESDDNSVNQFNSTLDVKKHSNQTPPPDKGEAGRGLKHPRLHNLKPQLNNRRQLRKNPTEPEKHFWSWVQGKQLGCKFRRQQGIGQYIVDFYCAEHALVVELDGESHYTAEAVVYDAERTLFLTAKGFKIIRFTNLEVMQNKEGVLLEIMRYLDGG